MKDATEISPPTTSRVQINAELRRIDAWEASADLRAEYAEVPDAPKPKVSEAALRAALGLVLTNRVFSVFMGDELDASMDSDRAGFTAEALARLTETVGQVIVVSHKPFDADNSIDLGAAA